MQIFQLSLGSQSTPRRILKLDETFVWEKVIRWQLADCRSIVKDAVMTFVAITNCNLRASLAALGGSSYSHTAISSSHLPFWIFAHAHPSHNIILRCGVYGGGVVNDDACSLVRFLQWVFFFVGTHSIHLIHSIITLSLAAQRFGGNLKRPNSSVSFDIDSRGQISKEGRSASARADEADGALATAASSFAVHYVAAVVASPASTSSTLFSFFSAASPPPSPSGNKEGGRI